MLVENGVVPEFLTSVEGLTVAVTGELWLKPQRRVEQKARDAGAYVQDEVSKRVDVLVRGRSDQWRDGKYGTREIKAARVIRKGHFIAVVEDEAFKNLLELGEPAPVNRVVAGTPVEELFPSNVPSARFQEAVTSAGPLDRRTWTATRTEQAFLRSGLFGNRGHQPCDLCGEDFPTELLVAAHVKPRRWCSPTERRDFPAVVMAACRLGCDELYERGYLAVDAKGQVLVRDEAGAGPRLAALLQALRGRSCRAFDDQSVRYFEWHRVRVFRRD